MGKKNFFGEINLFDDTSKNVNIEKNVAVKERVEIETNDVAEKKNSLSDEVENTNKEKSIAEQNIKQAAKKKQSTAKSESVKFSSRRTITIDDETWSDIERVRKYITKESQEKIVNRLLMQEVRNNLKRLDEIKDLLGQDC